MFQYQQRRSRSRVLIWDYFRTLNVSCKFYMMWKVYESLVASAYSSNILRISFLAFILVSSKLQFYSHKCNFIWTNAIYFILFLYSPHSVMVETTATPMRHHIWPLTLISKLFHWMILVLFVYGSFDKTEEAKLQGQYSVTKQYKPAKKECFMSTHSVELFELNSLCG